MEIESVRLMIIIYSIIAYFLVGRMMVCVIDNKTKYIGNTQGDNDFTFIIKWIFLLSIFSLFFLKRFRVQRKLKYLNGRIDYYKMVNYHNAGPLTEQITQLERMYKLTTIEQKVRINERKNKIRKIFKI